MIVYALSKSRKPDTGNLQEAAPPLTKLSYNIDTLGCPVVYMSLMIRGLHSLQLMHIVYFQPKMARLPGHITCGSAWLLQTAKESETRGR